MRGNLGDQARLHHIFEAIFEIEKYTQNKSHDDFFLDSMLQSACVRQLEIIGEAANGISDATKSTSPDIEWSEIVGLRNILIHEYFGVDLAIVWEIIQTDLPLLKRKIKRLLQEFKA